ncbi:MAG: hypothetical protein AAF206_27445, partial [Bacteroidota bacterium]
MIIKHRTSIWQWAGSRVFWLLGLGLMAMLSLLFWRNLQQNLPPEDLPAVLSCDAEKVVDEIQFAATDGVRLKGGNTQDGEKSRSGRFSSRLSPESNFGISYLQENLQAGDRYAISIWRYKEPYVDGKLIVQLVGNKEKYIAVDVPSEVEPSGWEKLETQIRIPFDYQHGALKIYPYGGSLGNAWFDDLRIERFAQE